MATLESSNPLKRKNDINNQDLINTYIIKPIFNYPLHSAEILSRDKKVTRQAGFKNCIFYK